MARNMLTDNFAEPLNTARAAKFDINAGDGNLTIDRLTGSEQVLVSGILQYFENQGLPFRSLDWGSDQAIFTLKAGRANRSWLHLPWAACNGAVDWQIHLNPAAAADITAHSNGGNITLNLVGMAVARVAADTGGGNVDVVLPDDAADLSVTARTGAGNASVEIGSGIAGSNVVNASSGAGNVVVCIPSGVAARIHVTTGMGKAIVDPRFSKIDRNTYQSPDFDGAADKIEITASSGIGNVSVSIR